MTVERDEEVVRELRALRKVVEAMARQIGVEESKVEKLTDLGRDLSRKRSPKPEGYVPPEWRDR